jgi:hypothetical protein
MTADVSSTNSNGNGATPAAKLIQQVTPLLDIKAAYALTGAIYTNLEYEAAGLYEAFELFAQNDQMLIVAIVPRPAGQPDGFEIIRE